ncbi:MAG TPA: molybdopterin-dependent oxidoreductase [Caulobacteraceae bacterium]|nr:molybdopterin-dependent oxidoreductase [Caulobacteraceae bacterium]
MRVRAALAALALLLGPLAAAAQDLTVVGLDGRTVVVSPKDFDDLPRATVDVGQGPGAVRYEGAVLTAILRLVGAPAGPTLHGKPVRDYVLVTGADGFAALLSLAETDAGLHRGAVILADTAGGARLAAHEGPWRLVIDGDLKPFRSVRNVVKVELKAAP